MPYSTGASNDHLRSIARKLIAAGRLPMLSTAINAGYGTGAECRLCGKLIYKHDIEYTVKDSRDGSSWSFHRICQVAWQLECAD